MIKAREFDLQYHVAIVALILMRPDLADLVEAREREAI